MRTPRTPRTPRTRSAAPTSASTSTPPPSPDDNGGTAAPRLIPDPRPAAARIAAQGATGYLTPDDIPPMNEADARVFNLLADGAEHTADEIIAAAGGYDPLRRARGLRGRRAHVNGRDVLLSLTCRRGSRSAAGIYRLSFHDIDDAPRP